MERRRRKGWLRCLVGSLLGVVVLLSPATRASAHAQLEESSPAAGSVLAAAPRTITLRFGESVERSSSAISLYDDHFRRVETGPVLEVGSDGTRLQVSLPQELGRGTFTVEYLVSSIDTHAVSGTFTFSVGAPTTVSGAAPSGQNDLAGRLLGGARFLGFVGLALGPGLLLVLVLLWPGAFAATRVRALLWCGLALLVASTLVQRVLQGVWASGVPMASVWTSPASLDTHSRRFDLLMAVRFYLVVGFAGLLATVLARTPAAPARKRADVARTRRTPRQGRPANRSAPAAVATARGGGRALVVAAGALAVGLVLTWALAGHAVSGELVALSVTANAVHLLALSVWLGGLALLVVCLTPQARPEGLETFLVRFSTLALTCVGLIAVTGLVMTWREAWPPVALWHTGYGRVLLTKLGVVVVVVALGALARRRVRRRRRRAASPTVGAERERDDVSALRRGVAAEVASGALVLALASALVVMVPAAQAYVPPSRTAVVAGPLHLEVEIPEPRPGDVEVTVTVRAGDGLPEAVRAMSGTATSTGGTTVALRPTSPGGSSPEGRTSFAAHLPSAGGVAIRLSVTTAAGTWAGVADLRLS